MCHNIPYATIPQVPHYHICHINLRATLPQAPYFPMCHIIIPGYALSTPNHPLPSTNTFTTPYHLWPFSPISHISIVTDITWLFSPTLCHFTPILCHFASTLYNFLPTYAFENTYFSFPHLQHLRMECQTSLALETPNHPYRVNTTNTFTTPHLIWPLSHLLEWYPQKPPFSLHL